MAACAAFMVENWLTADENWRTAFLVLLQAMPDVAKSQALHAHQAAVVSNGVRAIRG